MAHGFGWISPKEHDEARRWQEQARVGRIGRSLETCDWCGGSGETVCPRPHGSGPDPACLVCHGDTEHVKCGKCGGTGKVALP